MSRNSITSAKIISAIVKSLFFSGIMVIIFLSIVTGGFPPDFRKLSKAFNTPQEIVKTTSAGDKMLTADYPNLFDEEEVIHSLRSITSVPQEDFKEDLKGQLQDMQQEIFRLQQRVSELEEQAKESQKN